MDEVDFRRNETEPFHRPRFEEMIAEARSVSGWAGLSEDEREAVQFRLQYHKEATRLCDGIRDWPGRAEELIGKCPEWPARLASLREWRQQGEPLLAEARAMQAEDGPHAPHLKVLRHRQQELEGATGRLARALLAGEVREMNLLATVAQRSAAETGGIAFDADAYAGLMERVRALDARPALPDDLRGTVRDHLERDKGWTADRKRVGGFLEAARKVDSARNDLDEMARTGSVPAEQLPEWDGWRRDVEEVLREAGTLKSRIPGRELAAHLGAVGASQDAVDKAEQGIAERIARDKAARAAAAEAERQARELARLAAEQARAVQKEADERRERDRQRVGAFLDRADELPGKFPDLELAELEATVRGNSRRDGTAGCATCGEPGTKRRRSRRTFRDRSWPPMSAPPAPRRARSIAARRTSRRGLPRSWNAGNWRGSPNKRGLGPPRKESAGNRNRRGSPNKSGLGPPRNESARPGNRRGSPPKTPAPRGRPRTNAGSGRPRPGRNPTIKHICPPARR